MVLLLWVFPLVIFSQTAEQQEIRQVMDDQATSWNSGDIEGFMKGYWASDSLVFIGSKGITRGWTTTLANYKKGYPDKAAMGELIFSEVDIKILDDTSAAVIGKWKVISSKGTLSGHYLLIFEKKSGNWVITYDHTS